MQLLLCGVMSATRSSRFAGLTVVVLSGLALIGCSDDDDESTSDSVVASDTEATKAGDEAEDTEPASTDPPPQPPVSGGDSHCAVTITGDVSAEWTSDASGF